MMAGVMDAPSGWRYQKDGKEYGPVAYTALQKMARSGKLTDDDLVYSPTVGRWVKAWEVTGLFDLAAAAAAKEASPDDQALARRRRIMVTVVAVNVVVVAIIGLVLLLTVK